ncbi:hypothetical protein [Psittacicella hinzii]|uniref:Uncharacterized protein n=1 Tax=Psittacicella hinzii TaxID=2028575 RepID=A0A3A1Y9Q8_9GAMM|nr:hypothetical protein [Psittacicella hinzii]RIY34892.1 hypothetical protein CKF58_07390 [Psittacicella hinzii]
MIIRYILDKRKLEPVLEYLALEIVDLTGLKWDSLDYQKLRTLSCQLLFLLEQNHKPRYDYEISCNGATYEVIPKAKFFRAGLSTEIVNTLLLEFLFNNRSSKTLSDLVRSASTNNKPINFEGLCIVINFLVGQHWRIGRWYLEGSNAYDD